MQEFLRPWKLVTLDIGLGRMYEGSLSELAHETAALLRRGRGSVVDGRP
jgi:hypothetical protein